MTQGMPHRLRQILKFMRLVRRPRYRRALRYGVAATIEHKQALCALDFATVIDIGANKGQFSVFAAETFPNASIYAFEPLGRPSKIFGKVLGREDRVVFHQFAIGPKRTTATIYVSQRDDSSSLLPITPLQEQLFPGTGLAHTETVEVGPLSDFISQSQVKSPALLKIDVQGFELEALRGCENLLSCFDYIYVECSYFELYEKQALAEKISFYLLNRSFILLDKFNTIHESNSRPVQADFLFSRRKNRPISPLQTISIE